MLSTEGRRRLRPGLRHNIIRRQKRFSVVYKLLITLTHNIITQHDITTSRQQGLLRHVSKVSSCTSFTYNYNYTLYQMHLRVALTRKSEKSPFPLGPYTSRKRKELHFFFWGNQWITASKSRHKINWLLT